ncbi:unnamed protein product [Rangifer tarandus platyrhynchus]|uniref:Uncharacterized protein n=1 Tax=Rangifer tarandus platyrhynchus TaxID=3082113 RepID=A0AC59Z874_RANTA
MSSIDLLYCSESETAFRVVIEISHITQKKLKFLLQNWERFVAKDNLPREEAKALHEYLNRLNTNLSGKDPETLKEDQLDRRKVLEEFPERVPKEQLDRRRFLIKFPRVKWQLEEFIGKFHELADKVDKVHKGCTISNVVGYSTGAVSSILTIVGLALAPVTAGASVVLLATGIGLGAAAAVTHVSTSIIEHVKKSSAETEASHMMSSVVKKWKLLLEVLKSNPHIVDTTEKVTEASAVVGAGVGSGVWYGISTQLSSSRSKTWTAAFTPLARATSARQAGIRDAQLVAASAELRTTASCSHSGRGRLLGKKWRHYVNF